MSSYDRGQPSLFSELVSSRVHASLRRRQRRRRRAGGGAGGGAAAGGAAGGAGAGASGGGGAAAAEPDDRRNCWGWGRARAALSVWHSALFYYDR